MKVSILAVALLTLGWFSTQAQAQFWVCPVFEAFDLGNGYSEFWCDECPNSGGYYAIESNAPYGDCADETKSGCFMVSSEARRARARLKLVQSGLPDYLTKTPTPKNGVRILSERSIEWRGRKYRLFVIAKGARVAGVGYEIDPKSAIKVQKIESGQVRQITGTVLALELADVRYRLLSKGKR